MSLSYELLKLLAVSELYMTFGCRILDPRSGISKVSKLFVFWFSSQRFVKNKRNEPGNPH